MPQASFAARALRAALIVLIVAPAVFWRGGLLDEESTVFLPHYLGAQSALEKIFDPHVNDMGNYQGRMVPQPSSSNPVASIVARSGPRGTTAQR